MDNRAELQAVDTSPSGTRIQECDVGIRITDCDTDPFVTVGTNGTSAFITECCELLRSVAKS